MLGFDSEQLPNEKRELSGWTSVGFDDSAFAVGATGFGYGDEDDATKLPVGTTAVLLRHHFILKEHASRKLGHVTPGRAGCASSRVPG